MGQADVPLYILKRFRKFQHSGGEAGTLADPKEKLNFK